ncbi:leucyl aminopeptidase [Ketogulonicigenium robustum]|uniref:Leucyl aminopeptidase n=1 Tax=Ketogulonicigenium robustum TaxID=92947 RepID=A0A1W6NWQ1_9RHOB|nr:leucyl aminopeptidase family protein [Ketogulonicigenium robustum]ARO13655.1 leucyl aminopeptidase [Ketogulonicigenium robustum]
MSYDAPQPTFAPPSDAAIPLHLVTPADLPDLAGRLSPQHAAFAQGAGFTAGAGDVLCLPDADGKVVAVLVGMGNDEARRRGRFIASPAASRLPAGDYRLIDTLSTAAAAEFALGWLLEGYRFDRYRKLTRPAARLVAPAGVNAAELQAMAAGEFLTRDLINTPAADMGPADLAATAEALAARHGGSFAVTVGDDLLAANLPMIHAVGRAAAADRAPRLIDMSFGTSGPLLTLVGKGVCFDTGGLNIKPAGSMGLMKKDMGGAATVLGLAHMILTLAVPLRLRVLIPAVENSISGNAMRPQDVLTARNGLTVEINNTDAEGRLVLADALALASEEKPDLLVSMATLTGAARVALGPDVPPFYTDDDAMAAQIAAAAVTARDPLWRMPFHPAYEALIEPAVADLDNAPGGGMAGSITAALFLRRFAAAPYVHFDIYGWQPSAAPARPKGGVGQGARALLTALPALLGLGGAR